MSEEEAFLIDFYKGLISVYGKDKLNEDRENLMPDCMDFEWLEYCYSFESPY